MNTDITERSEYDLSDHDRKKYARLKKALWSGLASFLLALIFPKGFRFFVHHGFASLVKNVVYVVLSGLLTQKFADWILSDDESTE